MPQTDLYRHFSASGELLYVGISKSAIGRLRTHAKAEWASKISRIEIEQFPDRATALAAERCAIRTEKPLHNINGVRRSLIISGQPDHHAGLEQLRSYLNGMAPAEQLQFASRCETTLHYLRKAICARQKFRFSLAVRMQRESSGAVSARLMYPEMDWEYLGSRNPPGCIQPRISA
jgi:hypothetical protein